MRNDGMKFAARGDSIRITLREYSISVVAELGDGHMGIPIENITDSFERLTRVDSSLARRFGSSGLGLTNGNDNS